MDLFPKQVPPVKRPHFIQPHLAVDTLHGTLEELVSIRMKLMHGANFNDPAPWQSASFSCRKGCY